MSTPPFSSAKLATSPRIDGEIKHDQDRSNNGGDRTYEDCIEIENCNSVRQGDIPSARQRYGLNIYGIPCRSYHHSQIGVQSSGSHLITLFRLPQVRGSTRITTLIHCRGHIPSHRFLRC